MTKKGALSVLGALACGALTLQASVSHVLWHNGRRRSSAALLASGLAVDVAFLYSFLVPSFPLTGRVFHRGNSNSNLLALTFDDGPREPFTSQILDILKEEDVRATFFVLGENALRHPQTVKRIENEGHRVASHGMDHDILMWASARTARLQLKVTDQALRSAGVTSPAPLFRPPHGWLSPVAHRAIRAEGYTVIGWTKGVWDTAGPGVETIISRTIELLKPGSILLLHDGWHGLKEKDRSQTVDALPRIISEARARGLEFVTLEEMMEDAGW